MGSKHAVHKERIIELAAENDYKPYKVARILADELEIKGGNAFICYTQKVISELSLVKKELNENGISSEEFRHGWIKTKAGSYFIKNERVIDYDQIREQFIEDIKHYAPIYPELIYQKDINPKCYVIDIADLHLGKMINKFETGEDPKSIEEFKDSIKNKVQKLINRVKYYYIDQIIFVGGNDVLHVDNPQNTTSGGTRQDVNLMWFDSFIEARRLYVDILEMLINVAPVHFVFVPSNHDYMSGFYLAQNIEGWFHNNKNITFDISPAHRKYVVYGNSLIGLTHGNGAKESELPDLMKIEAKAAYATVLFCYWYVHHLHHKDKSSYKGKQKVQLEKDYRDVKIIHAGLNEGKDRSHVEYLRSANGTDSWHHIKGFQHTPQGVEAFIHDLKKGQIASYFE